MSNSIFYVRIKENIDPAEQGEALSGRIEHLYSTFDKGVDYPVLAMEYRETNKLKQTFYHMPTKTNHLDWFSSEYFQFSRV